MIKKLFPILLLSLILIPTTLNANSNLVNRLSGKILLAVEQNGAAWYVNPANLKRYYMGRPGDAFNLMRELGIGISEANFANLDSHKKSLAGKIILRVESNGEAYYIEPDTLNHHYLSRPADAFHIMRELALGITNANLNLLPTHKEYTKISQLIPFQPQAPHAQWEVDMFQDGCEEASLTMAMHWTGHYTDELTPDSMQDKITDISNYSQNTFNTYRDVSARDLTQVLDNYFHYTNYKYIPDITLNTIISKIKKGAIIIAPANGQLLKNPHFNPPGPINHMLLIHGYDKEHDQFITHDPGTRHGANFKYSTNTLYSAIRDYPTGYHEVNEEVRKNVIVVYR